MASKYICLEGPDGAGKSTLALDLVNKLTTDAKKHVRHIGFPGRESAVGRLIRDVFDGRQAINPEAMLWLFVAEAKDLEPQIKRHLADGDWVVCDRHPMVSALVYQGELHGRERVTNVLATANFTQPDRIYFIDVPASVSLERRNSRGTQRNTLYEPEQLDRVDVLVQAYRSIRERFVTSRFIDGTKPLEESLQVIWRDLELDS